jgi:hypothetical protein
MIRKIAIFILLLGIFYRVFSQNNEINISVVDSIGCPIPGVCITLDNDSTNNECISISNKSEQSSTYSGRKAIFKNHGLAYAHAYLIGYYPNTTKIDSNKLDYTITLFERIYDYPTLIIKKKSIEIDRNNFGDEFPKFGYDVDMEATFNSIDSTISKIETPHEHKNVEPIFFFTDPHAYPQNGRTLFFDNLSKKLKNIRFKVIVIDFTVLKSDSIIVTKVEGVSKKKGLWIKEMFCNLDSWKSADNTGIYVTIKYRLKIINDKKRI